MNINDPNVPLDNYPYTTEDGTPIPLDIIRPKGIIQIGISTTEALLNFTDLTGVAMFYATQDCYVVFAPSFGSVVNNTLKLNTLFIPKNHVVSSTINALSCSVKSLSTTGILIVQLIEKWSGLTLDTNFGKR